MGVVIDSSDQPDERKKFDTNKLETIKFEWMTLIFRSLNISIKSILKTMFCVNYMVNDIEKIGLTIKVIRQCVE